MVTQKITCPRCECSEIYIENISCIDGTYRLNTKCQICNTSDYITEDHPLFNNLWDEYFEVYPNKKISEEEDNSMKTMRSNPHEFTIYHSTMIQNKCPKCGSHKLITTINVDDNKKNRFRCAKCDYTGPSHTMVTYADQEFDLDIDKLEYERDYYKAFCETSKTDVSKLIKENTDMRKIIGLLLDKSEETK